MTKARQRKLFVACSASALAAAPVVAQTQQNPSSDASAAAPPQASLGPGSSGLEEIVVTAQRRQENLQRVPIAVTVASGTSLVASGIVSTVQLNAVVPGLNIRTNAGAFQPSIRGIGTSSSVVENPVALFIDGVYLPQQREGFRQLDDIAQIAVLKGPQGTLFGRNATGGVIQITTLAPSQNFSGSAKGEVDNFATARGSVYLTGGLADHVAASLTASYARQGIGWGDDLVTGRDTYKIQHDFSTRAKLRFDNGSGTDVTLIADYTDQRQLANSSVPYRGLPYALARVGPLPSVYDNYSSVDSFQAFRGGGVSLTADHDLSFAKLVSITSYRRGTSDYQFDNISVAAPVFILNSPDQTNEDYTEEVQLVAPKTGRLNWTIGAFYFHNETATNPVNRLFSGPFYAPLPTSTVHTISVAKEETDSIAPFAQATWEFLPQTNLTGGVRFTYEKRSLDNASVVAIRANGSSTTTLNTPPDLTIQKPTFRVALDHQFTANVLGYLSFNTGVKSGGFSIISPTTPAYKPEKLTDYEGGLKAELFDRRLRLNIGGFYYEYANVQVIQFVGTVQTVVNGASARLYGIDVDYEVSLGGGLRLSGGAEIEHSEFTNYRNAVFSSPLPAGGATIFAGDATGDRLPLAQKFTANLAVDYLKKTPVGEFAFNATASYNGGYFFEADNFIHQNSYTTLNSSLKWTPHGSRISLTVFGRNLLNNHVIQQASSQTIGYPVIYGFAPRTYGVGALVKF